MLGVGAGFAGVGAGAGVGICAGAGSGVGICEGVGAAASGAKEVVLQGANVVVSRAKVEAVQGTK